MKYEITPIAIIGQKCWVQNYRSSKKTWEPGTVTDVNARLREDGTFKISYEVVLDRTSLRSWGWPKKYEEKPLFLTVSDSGIKRY